MATEKRLKGIPYKCDNCIHTAACQRACSIFAYPFLDFMIRSASCTAYEPKSDAVEVVHSAWKHGNCMRCGLYVGETTSKHFNYCPNCGADMRGDGNG